MFYPLKQPYVKAEDNRSRLDFEQNFSLRGSSGNLGLSLSTLVFLAATVNWKPVSALTFDVASSAALQNVCSPTGSATGNLSVICSQLGLVGAQAGSAGSSGVGTQSQPLPLLITRQPLNMWRVEKSLSDEGSESQPNSSLISQQQQKAAQTQKATKRRPFGSADAVAANWGNFSTFLTAGATVIRHRNNAFEQGYNATIPSITLGGGYLISDNLEAGLTFNYSNSKADNNTGGGFNIDSYSPLLYINYLPFDNAFATLNLGYTRQNQTNDRVAVARNRTDGDSISTLTKGNLNANQYNLYFMSGYNHPIENLTIGPRIGVDIRQWEMNSYKESTNTGLELRYNNQNQTSIQSTLGLALSSAHSTIYGVLVSQLSASWVHEYANDSRTINAHFVQSSDPVGFFFQTENPARNWAVINLGASFLMQRDAQVFVNLLSVQGNRNFESYGGNFGVRIGW